MEKTSSGGENNGMTRKQLHTLRTRTNIQTVCIILLLVGLVALAIIYFLNVPLSPYQSGRAIAPKMQKMYDDSESKIHKLEDQYKIMIEHMNQTIEELRRQLANHTHTASEKMLGSHNGSKTAMNSSLEELRDEASRTKPKTSQSNKNTAKDIKALQTDLQHAPRKFKNYDELTMINDTVMQVQKVLLDPTFRQFRQTVETLHQQMFLENIFNFRQELSKSNADKRNSSNYLLKLQRNFTEILIKLTEHENAIKLVDRIEKNVTDFRKELLKMNEDITHNRNDNLEKIQESMAQQRDLSIQLNNFTSEVTNISNALTPLLERVSSIEKTVQNLTAELGKIKAKEALKSIQRRLKKLEEDTVNSFMKDVAKVKSSVRANKEQLNAMRHNMIKHLRVSLNRLTTVVEQMQGNVTNNVTEVETYVELVDKKVERLSTNVSAIDVKLSNLMDELDTVKEKHPSSGEEIEPRPSDADSQDADYSEEENKSSTNSPLKNGNVQKSNSTVESTLGNNDGDDVTKPSFRNDTVTK